MRKTKRPFIEFLALIIQGYEAVHWYTLDL